MVLLAADPAPSALTSAGLVQSAAGVDAMTLFLSESITTSVLALVLAMGLLSGLADAASLLDLALAAGPAEAGDRRRALHYGHRPSRR